MNDNLANPRTLGPLLWPHVAPCLGLLGGLLFSIVVFYFTVTICSATPRGQFILRGRPAYDWEAIQQYVMDYARKSSDANDVIFLGGSACREDIETNLFEKLTGLRAYNLGSMGILGYDGMEVVLRTYLQHHPAPRLLVFCIHPSEATVPVSKWGPIEIHDRFMACYGDTTQTQLATNPPPVTDPQPGADPLGPQPLIAALRRDARYTAFIAIHGVNGYENMPLIGFEKTYNQLAQEIARDKGYMGNDQVIPPSVKRSDIAGYPFTMTSDAFKTGTASIVHLAQANNVKVLIFFAPVPLEAANPDPGPGHDALHAWSSGVQPYCPGAIVRKPEMLLYDRPLFSDKMHLNRRGAVVLTTTLAQEVRRLLGGPASSSLPTVLSMKVAF